MQPDTVMRRLLNKRLKMNRVQSNSQPNLSTMNDPGLKRNRFSGLDSFRWSKLDAEEKTAVLRKKKGTDSSPFSRGQDLRAYPLKGLISLASRPLLRFLFVA